MGRKVLYSAKEDYLYGWNPVLAQNPELEEVDLDEFRASRGALPPPEPKPKPEKAPKPALPDTSLDDLLAGIDSGDEDD